MLAGLAFVTSALTASEATATTTATAPRTTAIAWAQCNFRLHVGDFGEGERSKFAVGLGTARYQRVLDLQAVTVRVAR